MRIPAHYLIFGGLLLSCCTPARQKQNSKNILGEWVNIKSPSRSEMLQNFFTGGINPESFAFYSDNSFDNKTAYFRKDKIAYTYSDSMSRDLFANYLGTKTNYLITADSIKIFDLHQRTWGSYKIEKLAPDTFIIKINNELNTFTHPKPNRNFKHFDAIALSTSGCFGVCPVINIIVKGDGSLLFYGERYMSRPGLSTGKITAKQWDEILSGFQKSDIDSILSNYNIGHTDDETVTSAFVKSDSIYKVVSDYGQAGPPLFTLAYIPLRYLYQTVKLKSISFPDYMEGSWLTDYKFRGGDKLVEMTQAENFLLLSYLLNGKIFTGKFRPLYQLKKHLETEQEFPVEYSILTDGRYYTFKHAGQNVTIDIGFNFFERNKKNWHWRRIKREDY